MSTLVDEHDLQTAANRLRGTMAAARVSFTWLGVRKALSAEQTAQAAEPFGASGQFLSAGKKLLDTKHPAYRAVTAVRGRLLAYWKGITLPYPEAGLRLIRQDDVAGFQVHMTTLRAELAEKVTALEEHYHELQTAARRRLGSLYSASDYPATLVGLFDVEWGFPGVEPPEYLRQLSPRLYEEEQAKVAARFEEALRLAEAAFLEEFGRLIEHLCERLSGQEDGRPKIFRDSAVGNLQEFFERFRHLNVRSSADLDQLVERAQQAVRGIAPQELRESSSLRQHLATQLSGVQSAIDGLLVDRPRRAIIRPARQTESA